MTDDSENQRVTVALPKGRLETDAWAFLREMGLAGESGGWPDRSLVEEDDVLGVRYLLVRPSDVVTYVSEGAADLGLVGKDVIMEANLPVYEVLDLGFGECRLGIAAPRASLAEGQDPEEFYRTRAGLLRVATKYPSVADRYFADRGIPIRSIPLKGSVELAPLVGLADVILDLVSSGKTLESNDLVLLEEVMTITARLIVNPVSMKVKGRITSLISRVRNNGRIEGGANLA